MGPQLAQVTNSAAQFEQMVLDENTCFAFCAGGSRRAAKVNRLVSPTLLLRVSACSQRSWRRVARSSFARVVDRCRTAVAFLDHEEFRVLFLEKKNHLIADEVEGVGTVDRAPVYPREVMRRALELSACAIILVHNHPSGDPRPSSGDISL